MLALVAAAAAAPARATPARGPAVVELRLSASSISGVGQITVTFRLREAGTVAFSVVPTAPARRTVARFVVRGRAGANRFRFPGRIERRLLRPGRYRLVTRGAGGSIVAAHFAVTRSTGEAGAARPAEGALDEEAPLRPLVVGCLLLAIPLLALAALPARVAPGPRAAALLAGGRPVVAVAGGLSLVVALALFGASLL